jgi:phage-related protein
MREEFKVIEDGAFMVSVRMHNKSTHKETQAVGTTLIEINVWDSVVQYRKLYFIITSLGKNEQ